MSMFNVPIYLGQVHTAAPVPEVGQVQGHHLHPSGVVTKGKACDMI